MIRVMSAAIIARRADRQRNILLCRRAPGTHCAGLWCTPGGKVEPGECDAEALAREVREETGVRIWPMILTGSGSRRRTPRTGTRLKNCYGEVCDEQSDCV